MEVTRINIFNLYTVGTVCCSCTNAAVLPELPGASYASKCFRKEEEKEDTQKQLAQLLWLYDKNSIVGYGTLGMVQPRGDALWLISGQAREYFQFSKAPKRPAYKT